jgi:predicted ATP-grasp superfamily ATP-dependent carboligase
MLKSAEPLVIFSQTGRALAESARRAGISTVVIDAFGDVDTQMAAQGCKALAWNERGPVDASSSFQENSGASGLVYGSGLEASPELLEPWSQADKLCGNSLENIININNPQYFFNLLDELEIPHPETSYEPPLDNNGWLIKRAAATGGGHVRHWTGSEEIDAQDYFQKQIAGPVMSVVFLGDGENAFIIGWNTQWTRPDDFVWGGAINRTGLTQKQQHTLLTHVRSLVSILQLKGLNSLDIVLDGEVPKVLELNPRPGATLELHDADINHGLLYWHLQSCSGRLPRSLELNHSMVRSSQVVFARQAFSIPANAVWPTWSHDRPATGVVFEMGEPVCTVTSTGGDESSVIDRLKQRVTEMERRCVSFQQAA